MIAGSNGLPACRFDAPRLRSQHLLRCLAHNILLLSASQALDLSHNSFAAVPALDSVPDVMLLRIANNNIKIVTKLELLTKLLVRVSQSCRTNTLRAECADRCLCRPESGPACQQHQEDHFPAKPLPEHWTALLVAAGSRQTCRT